jgi:hypothetical protein
MKLFVVLCMTIGLLSAFGFVMQKPGLVTVRTGSTAYSVAGRRMFARPPLLSQWKPHEGPEVPLEYSPVKISSLSC